MPRIYWDITKAASTRSFSGLNRVSRSLQSSLGQAGAEVIPLSWDKRKQSFVDASTRPCRPEKGAWFITTELFSEGERPGFHAWRKNTEARCAALFHDAIPLKHPEFTWPKSVNRHPFYLKELGTFDLVLANSMCSRTELQGYWEWLALPGTPPVIPLPLGGDFDTCPRAAAPKTAHDGELRLLMTGILEPRKNHQVVLEAFETLHREGLRLSLDVVGRVNPHFGAAICKRLMSMSRKGFPLRYHRQLDDAALSQLYTRCNTTVFPSITEGNGLPVLESLWRAKATLASNIPAHREHADKGQGVLLFPPRDADALARQLREWCENPGAHQQACQNAAVHAVPTWQESAQTLLSALN
jgi:glycosyltransferase involved in cell wall biosynthesis